jgi:hypothetical protein
MDRFTVTLEPELFNLLKGRAAYNRRSMSQEIVFLVECALAGEIDSNITIMRTLMMAQGGVTSIEVPEAPTPEHTETDEFLPDSSEPTESRQ